jgi:hypothetical protein
MDADLAERAFRQGIGDRAEPSTTGPSSRNIGQSVHIADPRAFR